MSCQRLSFFALQLLLLLSFPHSLKAARMNTHSSSMTKSFLPRHRGEVLPSEAASLVSSKHFDISGGATKDVKPKIKGGNASLATSVFNLANNVAGAGLLTLAAGKATGGTGWIPSIAICMGLAFASAKTFVLIGKACEMTGEQTFKVCLDKVVVHNQLMEIQYRH